MAEPPLKGLRVVELARILAGPWIGQTLADLGAQVIKVEAPEGDDTRRWGPPFIDRPRADGTIETVAAYFHATNRVLSLEEVYLHSSNIGTSRLAVGMGGANPPLDAARLDIMHSRLWGRAESVRNFIQTLLKSSAPLLFGYLSVVMSPVGSDPDRVQGGDGRHR